MQIRCDDDLYRVDRLFLGPPGKAMPLRATYRAYGFWAAFLLGGLIIYRMIGLPWDFVMVILLGWGTYMAAQWLDKRLTADRPLMASIELVWHELSAPRPEPADRQSIVWKVETEIPRWKDTAKPVSRWLTFKDNATRSLVAVGRKLTGRQAGRIYSAAEGWSDV